MRYARYQMLSILIHLGAILLLLVISAHLSVPPVLPRPEQKSVILFAPPHVREARHIAEPTGGGNRSREAARRGETPPRAHHTFVLPVARTVSDAHLLASSVIEAPDVRVSSGPPGLPDGLLNGTGLGRGGPSGIGGGCCGGAGDHNGDGGVDGRRAQPTTLPLLIYRVEPEFSEEARKAKYGGTVLISIRIGINGLPEDLRVVQGLGLGLDEKALEAVSKWRFRPASRGGKPVPAPALVEVHFHLL
jgi:protein TonB